MAERSVGRRATRRRSIDRGRIQALGRMVDGSGPGGVVANNNGVAMGLAFSFHW